jgi:hypothetical protein
MRAWKTILFTILLSASGAMAQQSADAAPQEPAPSTESQPPAAPLSSPAPDSSPSAPAQIVSAQAMPAQTLDQVIDRTIEREHALLKMLQSRTPLVETYVQDVKAAHQGGTTFTEDHYFLGRLDLAKTVDRRDYLRGQKQMIGGISNPLKHQYNPLGFSWMMFVDRTEFDRKHYKFSYLRREFLGDVRCIVFDVTPVKRTNAGRFVGRIWVEDQQYNIVRLNGSYVPTTTSFRMDSWRLNLIPGYWIPAYVYSAGGDFSYGSKAKLGFKSQSRIWGYDLKGNGKEGELTQLRLDSGVNDDSAAAQDATPLQAEREWQQQAEGNVVERLQNAGLLAPAGDVDKILETVANNLVVTNNLDVEPIKVRIMMTTPFETFSVGNTIVVSRGLVDVLPDEASLAMVLSHELAHILLGHNHGEKYAFSNVMLFSDEATYQNLGFRHSPEDEASADKKAMELLQNSPYKDKLGGPGLFLKALAQRAPSISSLLTPHLGDRLVDRSGKVIRLAELMKTAPVLDANKLDQLAALPLGGRIKVNAWDDHLSLIKTPPAAINSANDKLPFDVTPFFPRLVRYGSSAVNSSASVNASAR